MTEEQARAILLKEFDELCGNYNYQTPHKINLKEALFMGAKALEKELPKTVVKDEYYHNCCPNCGWIVSYDEGWGEKYVPHCENCGQAIDWSIGK